MSTSNPTKTPRELVAAGTSNGAGSTTRAVLDCRTTFGGLLTMKITNGGTGPTVQAEGRVLIAHNSGATPAAGSEGADWKTIYVFGGGTVASAVTPTSIVIDPAVMHLEVEFTANTGQAVTVEAYLSEVTNYVTA